MALELWTNADLYDVLRDDRLDPIPSYFLDTYFNQTHYSSDKEIIFSELPVAGRKLAPFVLPTEQGKPIFGAKGEKVKSFTPPYIKPKDAVRPTDARTIRPSQLLRNAVPSLQERFDARAVEVMDFHRRAIRMQIAWMAARAFIDGKVTVKYDRDSGSTFPEVTIDFGRDAGHTVVLASSFWSDPDYDIIGDLNAWTATMQAAKFGGTPAMMLVGKSVAPYIQKNKGILALLSTQIRGGESTTMERGLFLTTNPLSKIATLSGIGVNLEIWCYNDQVENDNGTMVDILNPKEIVLIAPGATGVEAYGAIYDVDAMQSGQAEAIDIFPKMFKTDDPGELYIMNQSAPLPIMLYPNRTLKAKVLA